MKKTLFLKVEYLDLKNKKISPTEEASLRESLLKKAIKVLKEQLKESIIDKSIKILAEHSPCEVVVEYDDANDTEIHKKLLQADIVEVIDSQVYKY